MWLSQRRGGAQGTAAEGRITISGSSPGVMSESEKRGAAVCAPGGYIWKPAGGEEVLVINSSDGAAVAGCLIQGGGIQPGEVMVFSAGGASVLLKNDGNVYITGNLHVSGVIASDGNEAV